MRNMVGERVHELGAYVITERLNVLQPTSEDPKAGAMKRHSGMFDLRDGKNNNTIVCSGMDVQALRRMQAKQNTERFLDYYLV